MFWMLYAISMAVLMLPSFTFPNHTHLAAAGSVPALLQEKTAGDADEPAKKKLPTMRPSPGVLVTVLRADKLKAIDSTKPRTATVLEVTLDPLAGSPPHRHPGPVCGYVLEGTFEFQIEGKEKQILKAGDTFFEPEMILHLVGRNPSSEGKTRVLATIIHPNDAKQLVIPEPNAAGEKADKGDNDSEIHGTEN